MHSLIQALRGYLRNSAEFSRLSASELSDIGIRRSEISFVARAGGYAAMSALDGDRVDDSHLRAEKAVASKAASGSVASDRSSPGNSQQVERPTSPYVLLFLMFLVAAAATWIAPAGQFQRVDRGGIKFVVPNSLQSVERHGIMPGEALTAISKGVIESAPVIFLILATGGALAVLEKTGAVTSALSGIGRSKPKDVPIIIGICVIFSLLGTVGAVMNSVVAFVPIGLLLARSINLPPILGVAFIYLGAYSGFNSVILSPTTTALSQRLAELPIFSGLAFHAVVYACFAIATIVFLIFRYENIVSPRSVSIKTGRSLSRLLDRRKRPPPGNGLH
jgi:uncharacterized ion transporter superfamily protein YfcC